MAFSGVIVNAKIMVGGLNLSGNSNSLAVAYGAEMLDNTVFQEGAGSRTRSFTPGLKTVGVTAQMFWDTVKDQVLFGRIGIASDVVTVADIGETEGDRVFFVKGVHGAYNPVSGEIGQLISANLDLKSTNSPLVRGQLMARGSKVASGNSVGINMGSAEGKRIYSALHIITPLVAGGGGEQIIGTIESDDNAPFATPTTRLTHATLTAMGADWQEASIGAGITDNFWRAKWVIAGAAPDFDIYWSFGILG